MARVRVYNNQTGQWGTVSEQFANSPKFSTSAPQAPTQQKGFLENLIGSLISPFKNTIQRGVGAAREIGLNRAGKLEEADRLMKEAQRRIMAGDTSSTVKQMLDTAEQLSRGAQQETVASRNQEVLTDPLQIAKDSAAMLSWGIPAKGISGIGKVGTRAIGGAGAGFGYSQKKDLEGLLASTVGGAGTSVLTGAVLDKLFPGKVPPKETVTDIVPEEQLGKVSAGTKMQQSAQVKMIGQKGLSANGGIGLLDDLDEAGLKIGKNVKNAGQLWDSSTKLLSDSSDEIQKGLQELSQRGVKVDTSKVFDALDEKISKQGLTSTKAAMEKVKQELVDSIGGERVAADPNLFYKIKYNAGGKGKWGVFTGISGDEASAWETVYNAMNQQLDDTFKQIGVDTLRQSNKNIATAMKGMDWSSKASEAVPQSPWGFYETVSLGTGLTYGGLPGAVGNIAVNKLLTSPKIQYGIGGLLNKVTGQGTQQVATQVPQEGIRSTIGSIMSNMPPALPGSLTQGALNPSAEKQPIQPTMGAGMGQPPATATQPTDVLSMLGLDLQSLMLLSALPVKEQNAVLTELIGEKVKGKGDVGNTQLIADAASEAYQALSGGDVKTGMIGGRAEKVKSQLGLGGDQPTLDFNVAVQNIFSAIAKARGGTALTASEKELLKEYLPRTGDSKQMLETKLRYIIQNPEVVVLGK